MNDYGFDYLNYITNVPNSMNFMKNNQMNMKSVKAKSSPQVLEPYQGFIRGNIFADQYDPYKNYKPMELNPSNEREALLYQLLQYKFILKDLNLYLDTHPSDQELIRLYHKYLGIEKQISDKYESMYGPLTLDSDKLDSNTWVWNNSPWPWEVI